MIETFKDLTESALADLLNNLEPEAYLVILRYPVVTVSVIVAIVNDSLGLTWVDLVLIRGKIEYFLEFLSFSHLSFR